MRRCRISVVVPARDIGGYLSDAVRSALDSDDPSHPLEIVIVDDATADEASLRVLQHWRDADPRVTVIRNPGRPGIGTARNAGIRQAQGDWVAFLDADDVWLPGGLTARWRVIVDQPDIEWLGADYRIWPDPGPGGPIEKGSGPGYLEARPVTPHLLEGAIRSGGTFRMRRPVEKFVRASMAWTGTVIATRALLLQAGGFAERLEVAEDVHLWCRLATRADYVYVPEVVALYRQRPRSITHDGLREERRRIAAYRLLREDPAFRPHRVAVSQRLADLYRELAYALSARGRRWAALKAIARSVACMPRLAAWRDLARVLRAAR
jgi:glycosyltransferase involved in cell wall biosynthesis